MPSFDRTTFAELMGRYNPHADGMLTWVTDRNTFMFRTGDTSQELLSSSVRGPHIIADATAYGAIDDGQSVTDGVMVAGTPLLTSATGAFLPEDVGKTIMVVGAGAAGIPLPTLISSYISPTMVRLARNASTTVSGVKAEWGTDNTPFIQAAIDAVLDNGGGKVRIARGPIRPGGSGGGVYLVDHGGTHVSDAATVGYALNVADNGSARRLASDLTIEFEEGVRLRWAADQPDNSAMLFIGNSSAAPRTGHTTVLNGTFDGNGVNQANYTSNSDFGLITTFYCTAPLIENCQFTNWPIFGTHIHRNTGGAILLRCVWQEGSEIGANASKAIRFEVNCGVVMLCRFTMDAQNGLGAFAVGDNADIQLNSRGLRILACEFHGGGSSPMIGLDGVSHTIVAHCIFKDNCSTNGGVAIRVGHYLNVGGYIYDGEHNLICNNMFINCAAGVQFNCATGIRYHAGSSFHTSDPTPTAVTASTLTDTRQSWTTDQFIGATVDIVSGTGSGQHRRIVSNTATQLTVEPNWSSNPDTTSTYTVTTKWSAGARKNIASHNIMTANLDDQAKIKFAAFTPTYPVLYSQATGTVTSVALDAAFEEVNGIGCGENIFEFNYVLQNTSAADAILLGASTSIARGNIVRLLTNLSGTHHALGNDYGGWLDHNEVYVYRVANGTVFTLVSNVGGLMTGNKIVNNLRSDSIVLVSNNGGIVTGANYLESISGTILDNNSGTTGAVEYNYFIARNVPLTVTQSALPAPTSVTATSSTSSGTLAAAQYWYKIAAIDMYGYETLPSSAATATLAAPGRIVLTWDVSGSSYNKPVLTAYKIYRASVVDGPYILMAASNVTGATVTDSGATALITVTKVANAGTGTAKPRNNYGYVTEAWGTATILNGATAIVAPHGMDATPTHIQLTLAENPTNDPGDLWVDTIGATNFSANCRADPGTSNADLMWYAVAR